MVMHVLTNNYNNTQILKRTIILIFIITIFVDMITGLVKKIYFSSPGTSERTREESTYMFFLDLLHEWEGI